MEEAKSSLQETNPAPTLMIEQKRVTDMLPESRAKLLLLANKMDSCEIITKVYEQG